MTDPAEWVPCERTVAQANLSALLRERDAEGFDEIHRWSVEHPDAFWERTVRTLGIAFRKRHTKMLDDSQGPGHATWLNGAELNIAESCFRSDGNDGSRAAIVTRRQGKKELERISVRDLERLSNRAANGFDRFGIRAGDAVALDLALSAEAVALYLGLLKVGAVAVSIPESLPSEEIEIRLRLGNVKAVVTQEEIVRGGKRLPIYDKVRQVHAPPAIVLGSGAANLRPTDLAWHDFLPRDETFEMVGRQPHDAINVLFSSGTTGEPKAIPWDHTTAIKAASDALYHHDIKPGDVVCWPTSMGWMMGPWLVFASLLNRATIAIYEGGPVERGFCEFVEDANVTMLGLVPSIVKGWRRTQCAQDLDWSRVRVLSSSGEASNSDDYSWLMQLNQPADTVKPVIEYCGGTELGGGYLANNLLSPIRASEFNGKAMGIDCAVLDDAGEPCGPVAGEVFLFPPSIGMSTRILNGDNDKVYYQDSPWRRGRQLRRHGDRLVVRPGPGDRYRSDGRADNTMNLGGIKIGSAEIERVVCSVAGIAGVADVAAVGVPPAAGGPDRLVLFVSEESKIDSSTLKNELQNAIKTLLNPLFHLHDVFLVDAPPRTASNKVMHRLPRDRYREWETSQSAAAGPVEESSSPRREK